MSLYHNGESCAYCKAKLFSEDDVVYCPVCGAPHHRECYNTLGRCALEQLHGTENEYSRAKELENQQKAEEERKRKEAEALAIAPEGDINAQPETTRCKMCGEEYPYKNASCPKCGAPNFVRINGTAFDFLGGVPAEHLIAEDITAEDAKKFVISNTHRYIPKFAQLNNKRKASWNWMAFLFPSCWLFSRKMYKGGFIAGTLLLISSLISYPVQLALLNLGVLNNTSNYAEMIQNMYAVIPEMDPVIILLFFISYALMLSVSIVCGILGDWWYKKYTVSSIKKIRAESQDAQMDYRKKGGVNVFLFLISYLVLNYLPAILVTFI